MKPTDRHATRHPHAPHHPPYLLGASAAALAAPAIADTAVTIRMGVLKLVHSMTPYFYERFLPAGYRLELIPFSTPTDGKDAVVTKSVDYGTFGIAAAILGAVGHQPVVVYGAECNKGMAVVARKDAPIASITDLKGKLVGILPGTTQQVFFYERLHMLGMAPTDIRAVRIGFADMPAALARGDVDAYVGAEPGPSLSLVNGSGKIVEYPYSTPMGSLNMILGDPSRNHRAAAEGSADDAGPAAQGQRLRDGAPRTTGRDDRRQARPGQGRGRALGAQCLARLADDPEDDRARSSPTRSTCWS